MSTMSLSLPMTPTAAAKAVEKLHAAGVAEVCGRPLGAWVALAEAEDMRLQSGGWVNPYRALLCLAAAVATGQAARRTGRAP